LVVQGLHDKPPMRALHALVDIPPKSCLLRDCARIAQHTGGRGGANAIGCSGRANVPNCVALLRLGSMKRPKHHRESSICGDRSAMSGLTLGRAGETVAASQKQEPPRLCQALPGDPRSLTFPGVHPR
jgi:hypothetical protein